MHQLVPGLCLPMKHALLKRISRRHRVALAIFVASGFLAQLLLALGIAPFLAGHSPTMPSGIFVSSRSGDVWQTSACGALGILHWEPRTWQRLPFGIPFPPNTAWLANRELILGYGNELVYLGPLIDIHWEQGAVPLTPPRWSIMSRRLSPSKIERTRELRVIEQAVGWPVPSMYGRIRYRLGDVPDPIAGFLWEGPRFEWAVRIPHFATNYDGSPIPAFDDPILPLRPILAGTALNTGFFALLFYAVWIVVRRIWRLLTGARARERFARGECIRCGYTLGGLLACPECGHARKLKNAGPPEPVQESGSSPAS